jgi:hypothetical protein
LSHFHVLNSGHGNESVEKLLPNENDENPEDCEQALKMFKKSKEKGKSRRYFKIARNFTVYVFAFWGLFSIITTIVQKLPNVIHHEHQHHQHPYQKPQTLEDHFSSPETRRSCACGNSTTEAISLGCVYDSLSPAWMQPHCQDAELTAEFERLGDGPNGTWIYYADRNRTQELSMPEVMAMADDPDARFHVSWEWHVVHCYMYCKCSFLGG